MFKGVIALCGGGVRYYTLHTFSMSLSFKIPSFFSDYVGLSENAFDSFETIPIQDNYATRLLDLRNNGFKGDLPCELCDSVVANCQQ